MVGLLISCAAFFSLVNFTRSEVKMTDIERAIIKVVAMLILIFPLFNIVKDRSKHRQENIEMNNRLAALIELNKTAETQFDYALLNELVLEYNRRIEKEVLEKRNVNLWIYTNYYVASLRPYEIFDEII